MSNMVWRVFISFSPSLVQVPLEKNTYPRSSEASIRLARRRQKKKRMTSTTAISTVILPMEATTATEASQKDKFAQRFRPANVKSARPTEKARENSSTPRSIVRELKAEDIKEHRLWALVSLVLCFFIIAPVVAFHHSRCIRVMKGNQELARAKERSDRVNNLLVFSNIVGGIIWVAILFVLGAILIFGAIL